MKSAMKSGLALMSAVALAAMMAGCGGSDAPVQIQFPDASTLPKPIVSEKKPAAVDKSAQSQGDPSEYTK